MEELVIMPNVVIRLGIDGDITDEMFTKLKTFYKNNKSLFSYAVCKIIEQPLIENEICMDED